MNYKESKLILEKIKKARKIVITSHMHPDDDSIASLLAVFYYLTDILRISKTMVTMVITGDKHSRWKYFKYFEKIQFVDDLSNHLENVDLLFLLDGDVWRRFSKNEKIQDFNTDTILIDHHPLGDDKFDTCIVTSNVSSTSEIIYEIFLHGRKIKKDLAEILLMGILGDTGSFRWITPNTAKALSVAEELIVKGNIDVESLLHEYDDLTEGGFKIFQNLILNSKFFQIKNWPKLMSSYVDKGLLHNVDQNDISSASVKFYFYIKNIKGVEWGFVVFPENDGTCSISFRSRYNSVDVRKLARSMKIGSGMPWASGANIKLSSPQKTTDYIFEYLGSNKPDCYKI